MEWYDGELRGGAELAASLLPETPSVFLAGVQLGVWGEAGWAWTPPKTRPEGGTGRASRPTDAQGRRWASR